MGLHCAYVREVVCIALQIFFIAILENQVESSSYEACKPNNCGTDDLNISYPFYIPGGGRNLCGYPGFEITCQGTKAMYGNYSVKRISYTESSIELVSQQDTSCFAPRPFSFLPENVFLKNSISRHPVLLFFYNCTDTSFPFQISPVHCTSNVTYNTSVALLPNGTFYQQGASCRSFTVVPVQLEGKFLKQTVKDYKELFEKGFLLKWDSLTNKSCMDCQESGGRCGRSLDTDFLCYCPHGTNHTKDCNSGGGKGRWWKIGLGMGIGASIATGSLAIVLLSYMIHLKRKSASLKFHLGNSTSHPRSNSDMEESNVYFEVPIFTSAELEEATSNFSGSNELGDGGFGTVYYGKLRDGREVAVKRLYNHNYRRVKQFMNEVEILTRLQHKNLVSLYGCTSRHSRELLLVYEYISNGTVADHIHGQQASTTTLPWQIRMDIAIETATALAYLHASDIVHRDVKTTNILLDKNFGVKVADFGLSRLFPNDVSHISTAPQGTPGYVDPEYHQCYQLTEKSDVYSFGVILVELVSSKPAVDINRERHEINLANFAINKIQKCTLGELIDPNLGFELGSKINRMTTSVAELAFRCLQHDKDMRPSMDEVLEELKAIACNESAADIFVDADEGEGVLVPSPPDYDDAQLPKNMQLTHSPVSVTQKWGSSSGSSALGIDG